MMKKYLCMAAAVLMFAACSNDNENPMENGLARMSFTADIEGMTVTKATPTGFDPNDKIGIIPVKQGKVEEAQSNLAYTYNSSSKFEGSYYFKDKEAVTFKAYYPIREEINKANPVISINTNADNQTIEGQAKNDILFATATTTYAKPEISYTGDNKFTHQMSKITLKFKAGAGVDDSNLSKLESYTLGSFTLDGSFDLSDGSLSLGNAKGSITMDMTDKISSELILLPQEVESGSLDISVTYNDMNYIGTLSVKADADGKTALLSGTNYIYEVTISNENFKISEGKIEDWNEVEDSGEVNRPRPIEVDLNKLQSTYTIDKDGEYILTGSTEQQVLIKANATVTIQNVNIKTEQKSAIIIKNGTATIKLEGNNMLESSVSEDITQGICAAGIELNGQDSHVIIEGNEKASLTVTADCGNPAIGSGNGGKGGNITIQNANITANAKNTQGFGRGAAIGSGSSFVSAGEAHIGIITIINSDITASVSSSRNSRAAVIGTGDTTYGNEKNSCDGINITLKAGQSKTQFLNNLTGTYNVQVGAGSNSLGGTNTCGPINWYNSDGSPAN